MTSPYKPYQLGTHDTYRRTIDQLRGLADWLHASDDAPVEHAAIDFYRLASRLHDMADIARKVADAYSGGVNA